MPRDINLLVCPFLTNHVGSGTGSNFESTCENITINCVYSEDEWDGGIIYTNCIQSKCIFWSTDQLDCILYYAFNTISDLISEISQKIRETSEDGTLASIAKLISDLLTPMLNINETVENVGNTVDEVDNTVENVDNSVTTMNNTISSLDDYLKAVIGDVPDLDNDNSLVSYLRNVLGETADLDSSNSLVMYMRKILGENSDTDNQSIMKLVKHFHDSHAHQIKHTVDSVPAGAGWPAGMAESTKNANEWLLQDDIDGDGEIYGPPVLNNGIPILNSLKNHPEWDCSWTETEE